MHPADLRVSIQKVSVRVGVTIVSLIAICVLLAIAKLYGSMDMECPALWNYPLFLGCSYFSAYPDKKNWVLGRNHNHGGISVREHSYLNPVTAIKMMAIISNPYPPHAPAAIPAKPSPL